MKRHFLTLLLTTLLSIPAAGQALGLGELIRLRRVSEKKAARLLQAKGWELYEQRSVDTSRFSRQLWINPYFGIGDTSHVKLFMYHSAASKKKTYVRYVNSAGFQGEPANIFYDRKKINGKFVRLRKALVYLAKDTFRTKARPRRKLIRGYDSGSAYMRSGECAHYATYFRALPWIKVEVVNYKEPNWRQAEHSYTITKQVALGAVVYMHFARRY